MLFKVIVQFLKQKVIEITKGILFVVGLIVGLFGGMMGIIFGLGWITYTLFHSFQFTNFLHTKGGYWDNVSSFGCSCFLFLFAIFVVICLSSIFIDWIKSNWIKAKEIVREREFEKFKK